MMNERKNLTKSNGPRIFCAGILDTKGDEIRFLARAVEEAGGEPLIMDIGLGVESEWADIPHG